MHGFFGPSGRVCVLGCLLVVGIVLGGCVSTREREDDGNFDRRRKDRKEGGELSGERAEAAERLRDQLPELRISIDETVGSPRQVMRREGYLIESYEAEDARELETFSTVNQLRWPRDPYGAVKRFLDENAALFGHGSEVLEEAAVTREHVTPHNGMRTVVWAQRVDGIPVHEATLAAHISKDGALVSLSSYFLPEPGETAAMRSTTRQATRAPAPRITAEEAVAEAASNIGEEVEEQALQTAAIPAEGPQRGQLVSAEFLEGEASAELVWLPMDRETLRLCWKVTLTGKTTRERYRVLVDANTGEVLVRQRLTRHARNATYRMFGKESPTPASTGHRVPRTNQPPEVERLTLLLSTLSTNASPEGWIPEGETRTIGNNVDARTDLFNDDANMGYDALITPPNIRPESARLKFDYPLDLEKDPSTYRAASVVNAFYWANWIHDVLYEYGFDEAAGNFQQRNFGRGGVGGDALLLDVQNGFLVPPPRGPIRNGGSSYAEPEDGGEFRMSLMIWTYAEPDRDGALDAEVLIHEYMHGVAERRVGKGVAVTGHQARGLIEGWADFLALAAFSGSADDLDGTYPYAAYSSYKWVFNGRTNDANYYYGMRRYPYSTDMSKNPLTFKDIDEFRALEHPEAPRNPLLPYNSYFGDYVPDADEWHAQGEFWCVTLWDARANLITKYGPEGNRLMVELVMDGMNLVSRDATFLEARDAILKADQVNHGGANARELWKAFARRGMGYGAKGPASTVTRIANDVVEDFDMPPEGGQKWFYATRGAMFSSPAVGPDGTIYIGSKDRKLHAVNPDGSRKWVYPQTRANSFDSSPAIAPDGTIYIGSRDAKMHAVNPDGTGKWIYQAYGEIFSSPAVAPEDDGSGIYDGSIYFGAVSGGRVYALNKDGTEKWVFQTDNTVYSSPALSRDGWVYIGSMDGRVYAFNAMTGAQKPGWPFTTGDFVYTSPAIDANGMVVVGSFDGNMYGIRPNGTMKWSFASGGEIRSSPVIGPDGTIYFASGADKLYALDPATGAKKWEVATPNAYISAAAPAVAGDGSIVHLGGNGYLYVINSAGVVERTFSTSSIWAYSSPAIAPDGTIYFGTGTGKLHALENAAGPAEGQWPLFRENLRRTGHQE